MHLAIPHRFLDDEHDAPAEFAGLLVHLDTIYAFALTLTGDADSAAELTEAVFASARDELWATLGGHGLRDRLLARCVSVFRETVAAERSEAPAPRTEARHGPVPALGTLLRDLPWPERAAIALVDQLRSSYAAGAAVLGVDVAEFRALLHGGRSVLFAAFRAGAR